MKQEPAVESSIMALHEQQPGEQDRVHKERWAEIRRMFLEQRVTVSATAEVLSQQLHRHQHAAGANMQRLAALVPRPRLRMIRFHGSSAARQMPSNSGKR